eukprot:12214-Heterococcus_DN1.PRE.4
MSGSGTTIFALGRPRERMWPLDFTKKWGCYIWKTRFINRPEGQPHLWYKQEKPYSSSTSSSGDSQQ